MSKETIISCDLCWYTGDNSNIKNINVDVIMTTEQDEWRATTPYFEKFKIDVCNECQKRRLNWEPVFWSWAQWYNDYFFKK